MLSFGYLLSFFLRNVNVVLAKDLTRDFALSHSDLGLLTSSNLLAVAHAQLPIDALFDRYRPCRVVASLMCVANCGAGRMVVTAQIEAMLGKVGKCIMFYDLAAPSLSLLAAKFACAVVSEKALPGKAESWGGQFGWLKDIFSRLDF